jgi:UDP-N-acetylglucosamine:LPS N-acetylglucosamine transferase
VYPALAVAAALTDRQPDCQITWLGSRYGIERELIEREGIPFEALPGGPLVGVGLRGLLHAVGVLHAVLIALGIVRRIRPKALLITGGWPTVAPTLACWLRRVPVLIYLPDLEPTGAIRFLSRFAARVAVNAEQSVDAFPPGLAVETGYPLRPELLAAAGYDPVGQPKGDREAARREARERFELADDLLTLLVMGGSRGARSINQELAVHLPELLQYGQIIHITGKQDWEAAQGRVHDLPFALKGRYHPHSYLHTSDMALALAAADLVVARAGAGTLGEFPLFGLPAILVPYPHAWHYQKTNADYLASRGAAVRLDDEQLSEALGTVARRLLVESDERQRMARAAQALARPDAAGRIADLLIGLTWESRGRS